MELEEIEPKGDVLDSWVEEIRFSELLSVKVVVPGGESNFGLAEDDTDEPVLTNPFGCRERACKGRELIDKVSHGFDFWLPHYCIERDGFHPPSHHFRDGNQGRCDCRHVWAVCEIKGII